MKKIVLLLIFSFNIFGAVEISGQKENFNGKEIVVGSTTDGKDIVLSKGEGFSYEILFSYDLLRKSKFGIEPYIAYGGTLGSDDNLNYKLSNQEGKVTIEDNFLELGTYFSYDFSKLKLKIGAGVSKPNAEMKVLDETLVYGSSKNIGMNLSGVMVIKTLPWYIPNGIKLKYSKNTLEASKLSTAQGEQNIEMISSNYPKKIEEDLISVSLMWNWFDKKGGKYQ